MIIFSGMSPDGGSASNYCRWIAHICWIKVVARKVAIVSETRPSLVTSVLLPPDLGRHIRVHLFPEYRLASCSQRAHSNTTLVE